jgi:hypothetical protein
VYYKDKFFTERLMPPIFVPTQKPFTLDANLDEENDDYDNDLLDDEDSHNNEPENNQAA